MCFLKYGRKLAYFLIISFDLLAININKISFENSFIKESSLNSTTLVVTFGGLGLQIAMPPFEFMNMLKPYKVNQLFVRDLQQAWYQFGLELNSNIPDTIPKLKLLIDSFHADKIIFFGNSSGGYAALLFGFLFKVDEVHAFVPYSFLEQDQFKCYPKIKLEYLDLQRVFNKKNNQKTKFHIYYSIDSQRDVLQAERLHFDNITHHIYKGKLGNDHGHDLIQTLKKEGLLAKLIEEILN